MERKSIYVPKDIEKKIENDALMFEIYLNDGKTINRNGFISMVIKGYYDYYSEELCNFYDNTLKILDSYKFTEEEIHDIASRLLYEVILPQNSGFKKKGLVRLNYKPTNETKLIIEKMDSDAGEKDSFSSYFCKMLMSFYEKPFSMREQLIFRDTYTKLVDACNLKQPIIFNTYNKKEHHEVIPYRVVCGPEEMYNFLLCAEYNNYLGKVMAQTYRLNRIVDVERGNSNFEIDKITEEHLNNMVNYGPQYVINEDIETCVRLSDNGVRNYKKIYFGRPKYEKIETNQDGHYYYFKCSLNQLFLYFRRFEGTDAEIVSPEELRNKIILFHETSLNIYNGGS